MGWMDRRKNKAATICYLFGEQYNNQQEIQITVTSTKQGFSPLPFENGVNGPLLYKIKAQNVFPFKSGFIQGSLSKIQGLFKDFSRLFSSFQGL